MKEIDFKGINYIGADIVPDLIKKNTKEFTNNEINFKILDLTSDGLPKSDLIFFLEIVWYIYLLGYF